MKMTSSTIQTITVGDGIAPSQPETGSRTVTADREFHPAPKNRLFKLLI